MKRAAFSGARQVRLGWRERITAWLRHHAHSFFDSLQRMLSQPVPTLLTWLLIGIALALPATLYVGLENLYRISQSWEQPVRISLYLDSEAHGAAIARRLAAREDIHQARFISKIEALREFKALSGFAEALDSLESNPLPAVVVVEPSAERLTPARITQLHAELSVLPHIERAELDFEWLERLHQMLRVGQRLVGLLAVLLAASVLLVIGNTIRLAIDNRREEIIVVSLVGGTSAFTRRPFLYSGLWHGIGGGTTALLLVAVSVQAMRGPIAALSGLYDSEAQVTGLSWNASGLLVAGTALLGILTSWITVARYLHEMRANDIGL